MRRLGLAGVVRGRNYKVTTLPDPTATRPPDLVARQFKAVQPNELWVADLTYVAMWCGFVYVAFVIGLLAADRRLAGVEVAAQRPGARCLQQALHDRPLIQAEPLVHHSDRDSYDNALAEAVIGLFKTEKIHRRGP